MAKKKKAKHKKKVHRRQSSRPQGVGNAAVAATSATSTPEAPPAVAAPTPVQAPVLAMGAASSNPAARSSYVGSDVRRIGILATSCVVAEVVLWYLFTYTGLGSAAYGLIK